MRAQAARLPYANHANDVVTQHERGYAMSRFAQISHRCIAALAGTALAASMLPIGAAAFAQEPARGTDLVAGGIAVEQLGAAPHENSSSWRYANGKPIADVEDEGVASLVTQSMFNIVEDMFGNVDASFRLPAGTQVGIDISVWQNDIDWDKAKAAGVQFAIIRCGYGSNIASQDDQKWLRNVKECERTGIPYGVYLYSYAENTAMANSEADHTIRLLREANAHPSLPVYYDLEEDSMGSTSNVRLLGDIADTFCSKIEAAGYRAGVYANLNWWNNYLTDGRFERWDRWVAQWNSRCTYGGGYHLWQTTSSGAVNGIVGRVDMNFALPFGDVNPYHWFNADGWLDKALESGAITGLKDDQGRSIWRFEPDRGITRAELACVVYRMANPSSKATTNAASYEENTTPFTDVADKTWYSAALNWAYENNVMEGYRDDGGELTGEIAPDKPITREELATMLFRYAKERGSNMADYEGGSYQDAIDADDVSEFAVEAAEWCYDRNVMAGSFENQRIVLRPGDGASRAEASKMTLSCFDNIA